MKRTSLGILERVNEGGRKALKKWGHVGEGETYLLVVCSVFGAVAVDVLVDGVCELPGAL